MTGRCIVAGRLSRRGEIEAIHGLGEARKHDFWCRGEIDMGRLKISNCP
jgi:hypothetical protein